MHRLWIKLYHRLGHPTTLSGGICSDYYPLCQLTTHCSRKIITKRSDLKDAATNHQLVDALEVLEGGELDDHFPPL